MVKFISYDGKYPVLCAGTLVLEIGGERVSFKRALISGGCVSFDKNYGEHVSFGAWRVNIPAKYAMYRDEIAKVVNENVRQGCCGGCI